MGSGVLPVDWYRSTLSGDDRSLFWEEGAAEKVTLALRILEPQGNERVLDLACASGQRTLELSRRGFCVVGTDIDQHLIEIGACEAEAEDIYPFFVEADVRELTFMREFGIVLSLGGGAFGHFEDDSDDRRVMQLVSQALKPGGRLLMQLPNLVYVERYLPERTWLESEHAALLVDQCWMPERRRIVGTVQTVIEDDHYDGYDPVPFCRRVYSVEELAQLFESVGMELVDVFNVAGKRCAPTEDEQELFVEARF